MGIYVIVLYVLAMVAIGVWAMRRTRSVGDFFLGGRSIGPWMSAFAYGTTYFSAVLFIGYGGKLGWGFGLHTMWIVAGNVIVGSLLAWWVLGRRTREMTARLGAMTMPAFLAERYKSPQLKVAAAVLIFVFLVPYSASVYKGLNYLFQSALGMQEQHVMLLLAALTAVYLVLGGYFAVTLTDFIMGIVMVFGAGALVYSLTAPAGGIVHTTKLLTDWDTCSPVLKATLPGGIPGWMLLASLVVVTSFGPWGLPQMVQKFYSIKSGDQIKRAMIVVTIFSLIVSFGAYYSGALTHVNVPTNAKSVAGAGDTVVKGDYTPKTELPVKTGPDGKPMLKPDGSPVPDYDKWVPKFLSHRLPMAVMLLIVLLVLSASMSTLSSLVLVSSSAIAMDLFGGVVKPNVERKTVLLLMRVLCGVFVLLSLALAMKSPAQIVTLMVISWGLLAGAFAAPYVYGLFWRRANAAGATAGLVTGLLVAALGAWFLGDPKITPDDPGVPVAAALAMLVPFIVVPIVTLMTKPMPKEDVNRAFSDGSGA